MEFSQLGLKTAFNLSQNKTYTSAVKKQFFSTGAFLSNGGNIDLNKHTQKNIDSKYVACNSRSVTPPNDVASSVSKNTLRHKQRLMMAQWLMSPEVQKAKSSSSGNVGLGPNTNQPFPLNPFFKPPRPISHSLRMKITDEYLQGASIEVLARKFNTSPQRIEALIKLRRINDEFEEKKKPILHSYNEVMEKMLNACTKPEMMQFNDGNDIPLRSNPVSLWKSLPEGETFTPQEAAKILKWPSIEELNMRQNATHFHKTSDEHKDLNEDEELISSSPSEVGKRVFRLIDLSTGNVYRRDTGGDIYVKRKKSTT